MSEQQWITFLFNSSVCYEVISFLKKCSHFLLKPYIHGHLLLQSSLELGPSPPLYLKTILLSILRFLFSLQKIPSSIVTIRSSNPTPGHISRKDERTTCTPMFTEALFTIAKTWKQLKCPSAEKWIKMWCVYTMQYYSAIRKNEIMPFVATRMDLEIIILNEVRQRQLYGFTCMWNLKNSTNELIYKTEIDSET